MVELEPRVLDLPSLQKWDQLERFGARVCEQYAIIKRRRRTTVIRLVKIKQYLNYVGTLNKQYKLYRNANPIPCRP